MRIGWQGQETDAETWLRAAQGDEAARALCGLWGDYKAYGIRPDTEASGTITGQAAAGAELLRGKTKTQADKALTAQGGAIAQRVAEIALIEKAALVAQRKAMGCPWPEDAEC